jgi:large subunit ribosomal protein L22
MDVHATAKYLPISPQKLRLVCDQVRGMEPRAALDLLRYLPKKGSPLVSKVIKSAMANAENNFELDPGEMYISEIYANGGRIRKWRRFGARGRFKPWLRRSSHLTVVLSEREQAAASEAEAEERE